MSDNDFGLKQAFDMLLSKMEAYERKMDNYQTKINHIDESMSELLLIKHQIDTFTKQLTSLESDVKALRDNHTELKTLEYMIKDLVKWQKQMEQAMTINDMIILKQTHNSITVDITQVKERVDNLKEELGKELKNQSLIAGGGAGGLATALAALLYALAKTIGGN